MNLAPQLPEVPAQSTAIFWCTPNGICWKPSVTVGVGNTNGLTAVMYVYRPSNSNSKWGINVVAEHQREYKSKFDCRCNHNITNTVTMALSVALIHGDRWLGQDGAKRLDCTKRNTTTGQTHSAAYFLQAGSAQQGL